MDDRRPAPILLARSDLAALAHDLGSVVVGAESVLWGDAGATVRLTLADGRVVAARRLIGPDALERATIVARRTDRFAAAGIEVPHPVAVHTPSVGTTWLIAPWRGGKVGAASLDDATTVRRLATAMGSLARRIAAIADSGLAPDRTWADRDRLADAAIGWLDALDLAQADALRVSLAHAIDSVHASWASDPGWDLVVAHGDFAPINVLVGADAALTLLDLHDVAIAPRLFDVAWWGWVVRYHHPAVWAIGWPGLVLAAGMEGGAAFDQMAARIGLVRCLERAARAEDDVTRSHWVDRLRATAAW